MKHSTPTIEDAVRSLADRGVRRAVGLVLAPHFSALSVGQYVDRLTAAATPLDTWKQWATKVTGLPVDSGHFLTEENPDATARLLREFFLAG